MRRTSCSACKHEGLDTFLDLGLSPIADAYTKNANDVVATYPLELAVCNKCWLVQLLEVVDQEILFGTGYSFYSSASPPLSHYHEQYAQEVLRTWPTDRPLRYVLEIGCNDGDFLRHFKEAGHRVIGIDPAIGPAQVAWDRGLDVRVRPFDLAYAKDLVDFYGHSSLVIANHVLAHVADVSNMLAGIATVLDDDGIAIIEVQYLPDLLVNNAFDLVYHEHRNFFSFTSLEAAALRHGLHVVEAQTTSRQGGSIRVTFSKKVDHKDHLGQLPWLRADELWLQGSGPYEGFQGRVNRIRARLADILTMDGLGTIAGYGAPAKATTLLNYCRITSHTLEFVTDTTVAKQGRFIPGTGIPIVSPLDPLYGAETYLLLAHNYTSTIIREHARFLEEGGNWIIPIPSPVLI